APGAPLGAPHAARMSPSHAQSRMARSLADAQDEAPAAPVERDDLVALFARRRGDVLERLVALEPDLEQAALREALDGGLHAHIGHRADLFGDVDRRGTDGAVLRARDLELSPEGLLSVEDVEQVIGLERELRLAGADDAAHGAEDAGLRAGGALRRVVE